MVKWAFMVDESTNNIGLYDEPAATGDFDDPNSARNDPLNDPANNLQHLYWHIQYDNMEVLVDTTVTITHPTIAARASPGGGLDLAGGYDWAGDQFDYTLYTHSLGVIPHAYVAIGQNLITPGFVGAVNANGAVRYISVHADTTKIWLHETQCRGETTLTGGDVDYQVIIIKPQPPADGNTPPLLIDWDSTTGLLILGDGRWRSDRRYLQVVPGGTPFGLALTKTLDLSNGAPRFVNPDGTTIDPVPVTTKMRITTGVGSPAYGDAMSYDGSFTGGTFIEVQAP